MCGSYGEKLSCNKLHHISFSPSQNDHPTRLFSYNQPPLTVTTSLKLHMSTAVQMHLDTLKTTSYFGGPWQAALANQLNYAL